MFHSVSGRDEDYHETIYKIPKVTLSNFIDNYYEDFLYNMISDCSNFPRFKGKFVPPLPKKTYILEKCMMNADNFPHILPSGYYKVALYVGGTAEMHFVYIGKVFPKLI